MSLPLNYIYNKFLSTVVFPDCVKYAIMKPLYKNGNKHDVSNYRPVLFLTSFSKILKM